MIKEYELHELFHDYDIFGNDMGSLEKLPKLKGHRSMKLNLQRIYVPRLGADAQAYEERTARTNVLVRKFEVKGTDLYVSTMRQIFPGEIQVVSPEDLRFEFSIDGSVNYLGTQYNVRFLYSLGNISQDLRYEGVSVVPFKKDETYTRTQLEKLKSYLLDESNIDIDIHWQAIKFI